MSRSDVQRHHFTPTDFGGDECRECGRDIRAGEHYRVRGKERRVRHSAVSARPDRRAPGWRTSDRRRRDA